MNAPSPVVPVLVCLHPDGFVEVYGPPNVRAVVANVPAARTAREEAAAQDWLDRTLPRRFAELRVPSGPTLRATGRVECVSAAELAARAATARELGELVRGSNDGTEEKEDATATVATPGVGGEV